MPSLYFWVWISKPVRVEPSFLASMTPAAWPVDEEEVIRLAKAVPQGEFADGDPAAGVDIGVGPVLDEPSSGK